jgi:hypothetical protein
LPRPAIGALNRRGVKGADLDAEQRRRALAAPDDLRGTALADFILGVADGDAPAPEQPAPEPTIRYTTQEALAAQEPEHGLGADTREGEALQEAREELAALEAKGAERGYTAAQGKRVAALRHQLGLDEQARKAPAEPTSRRGGVRGPRQSYSDAIKAARPAQQALTGRKHGPTPKHHQHIREAVSSLMGAEPVNGDAVAAFAGVGRADLVRLARDAPAADLVALRDLGKRIEGGPWCSGRHLAGALAVWADQLDGQGS